jgi:hypothetical protein
MFPGEITRVIAKFDRVGQYVWHCHILSHEDHEMMRRYEVLAPPTVMARTGATQLAPPPSLDLSAPVAPGRFSEARIFDVTGRLVREFRGLELRPTVESWDGRDASGRSLPSGVYFWRLRTPERTELGKKVIVR